MLVGLAAGCSSSATLVNHPVGSSGVAHVGAALDLKNQAGRDFHITLSKVADPAQTVNQNAPANGKRFIAVIFDVDNISSQTLSADGDLDANIIGSDGNVYTPTHNALSECGSDTVKVQLAAGKSGSSCVSFEIKSTVNVSKVQFYPAAGSASDYGEWLVP
jgi:hypothetical protein